MSEEQQTFEDPLRICPQYQCLVTKDDSYCPWHGVPVKPLVGQTIGAYKIEKVISRGGTFGAVYEASIADHPGGEDPIKAAIKVLKPIYCYQTQRVDDFIGEAKGTNAITRGNPNPNVVAISFVARAPTPYIAMQCIEGDSLDKRIDEIYANLLGRNRRADRSTSYQPPTRYRPIIPARETLDYLIGIARGLKAAHNNERIHRDLKPLNVMLRNDSESRKNGTRSEDIPCVIDWGLAIKLATGTAEANRTVNMEEIERRKKLLAGTYPYMAPECFERAYSTRTDIYAFGVTAFEMLTGRYPFKVPPPDTEGRTLVQAWQRAHSDAKFPLKIFCPSLSIPKSLRKIITTCLHRDPKKRYANGAKLEDALLAARRRVIYGPWVKACGAAVALVAALCVYIRMSTVSIENTDLFTNKGWWQDHSASAQPYVYYINRESLDDLRKSEGTSTPASRFGQIISANVTPEDAPSISLATSQQELNRGTVLASITLTPLLEDLTAWAKNQTAPKSIRSYLFTAKFKGPLTATCKATLTFVWDQTPPSLIAATVVALKSGQKHGPEKQLFPPDDNTPTEDLCIPDEVALSVTATDENGVKGVLFSHPLIKLTDRELPSDQHPSLHSHDPSPETSERDQKSLSFRFTKSLTYGDPSNAQEIPQRHSSITITAVDYAGNKSEAIRVFPRLDEYVRLGTCTFQDDGTVVIPIKYVGDLTLNKQQFKVVRKIHDSESVEVNEQDLTLEAPSGSPPSDPKLLVKPDNDSTHIDSPGTIEVEVLSNGLETLFQRIVPVLLPKGEKIALPADVIDPKLEWVDKKTRLFTWDSTEKAFVARTNIPAAGSALTLSLPRLTDGTLRFLSNQHDWVQDGNTLKKTVGADCDSSVFRVATIRGGQPIEVHFRTQTVLDMPHKARVFLTTSKASEAELNDEPKPRIVHVEPGGAFKLSVSNDSGTLESVQIGKLPRLTTDLATARGRFETQLIQSSNDALDRSFESVHREATSSAQDNPRYIVIFETKLTDDWKNTASPQYSFILVVGEARQKQMILSAENTRPSGDQNRNTDYLLSVTSELGLADVIVTVDDVRHDPDHSQGDKSRQYTIQPQRGKRQKVHVAFRKSSPLKPILMSEKLASL